jgi:hypothetical protein
MRTRIIKIYRLMCFWSVCEISNLLSNYNRCNSLTKFDCTTEWKCSYQHSILRVLSPSKAWCLDFDCVGRGCTRMFIASWNLRSGRVVKLGAEWNLQKESFCIYVLHLLLAWFDRTLTEQLIFVIKRNNNTSEIFPWIITVIFSSFLEFC